MYEERFYRNISKPRDMLSYEVKLKETDLFCCTKTDLRACIEERVIFYRHQLETYIKYRPEFKESLTPVKTDIFAPGIVREMIEASKLIGVGPMACVAGAIAEYVGRDIAALTDEYIVENGGDICLKTDHERVVLIYAKDSPYSEKIGVKLKGRDAPYGVCTSSGTIGHSLSFGNADTACIVGDSSLFADGLATYVGNIVKKRDDVQVAIEKGKTYPGISGILIIIGDHLGVWGDIEIIKV
ncbi:MAG: UPF0280 family protein [Proteobacteria bacterium]|nr:UPF0280 family protein [Pseudomonadota bacterium]